MTTIIVVRVVVLCLQACDCSWLYFDSQLLEPILASILKSPQDAHQMPYILAAFLDAQALLQHAPTPTGQADSSSLTQVRFDSPAVLGTYETLLQSQCLCPLNAKQLINSISICILMHQQYINMVA